MANPISTKNSEAARQGFDNVVDHLTMLELVKGVGAFKGHSKHMETDGLHYGQGEKTAAATQSVPETGKGEGRF